MHMHSLFHIILLLYVQYLIRNKGPGWLNELGSWIIKQRFLKQQSKIDMSDKLFRLGPIGFSSHSLNRASMS
jgi:hypothetical protein